MLLRTVLRMLLMEASSEPARFQIVIRFELKRVV